MSRETSTSVPRGTERDRAGPHVAVLHAFSTETRGTKPARSVRHARPVSAPLPDLARAHAQLARAPRSAPTTAHLWRTSTGIRRRRDRVVGRAPAAVVDRDVRADHVRGARRPCADGSAGLGSARRRHGRPRPTRDSGSRSSPSRSTWRSATSSARATVARRHQAVLHGRPTRSRRRSRSKRRFISGFATPAESGSHVVRGAA